MKQATAPAVDVCTLFKKTLIFKHNGTNL